MAPHSSNLAWKIHWRRSLEGSSPWGHEESDMTERLHFHFSLSCIGEANGNLLQCSCLENPRDRGAWWAAVYGVAQSQTRLKQLSSSSSRMHSTVSSLLLKMAIGSVAQDVKNTPFIFEHRMSFLPGPPVSLSPFVLQSLFISIREPSEPFQATTRRTIFLILLSPSGFHQIPENSCEFL